MDNVSHTLVGAAMGEAGLKKYTGLGMATLMIAANLPDLDVLAIPFGHNLTFRRGWTHGSLAVLVLPLVLTACVVGFDRLQARHGRRPDGRAAVRVIPVFLLSLLGFLSHPFLDWLNNYGIRLLMPFSHEWFYGDALFIIDPWLWLAMGVGIYLSRRRRRRGIGRASGPAQWALALLALYIVLMILGSRSASRVAEAAIEQQKGRPAERLMAGPVPLNPLQREIIFDAGDNYGSGLLTWTPRPTMIIRPDSIPKNFGHEAVREAMSVAEIRDFLYWSRFPFFSVQLDSAGYHVQVGDARYTRDAGAGWASAQALIRIDHLDSDGREP